MSTAEPIRIARKEGSLPRSDDSRRVPASGLSLLRVWRLLMWNGGMKRLLGFVLALARELSDEAAYARYLTAHGVPRSATAWRAFSETRMREKFGRPKCC